jgi:hypothetical protein
MGEHLACMADHGSQQFVLDRCEADFSVPYPDHPTVRIHPKISAGENGVRWPFLGLHGMPEGNAHPGQQFSYSERLGHVIISP